MSDARHRRRERGTTVLITVMVTTLLTAIGVLAVRSIAKIDQAVGYSRQGTQTLAVAELGTTAALAQIAVLGADYYALQMDGGARCGANGAYPLEKSTCYRMRASEIETTTAAASGETLFETAVPGSETGSFGPTAGTMGYVSVEMTEKYKTSFPVPGARVGDASYVSVTMTTTGVVRPVSASTDECVGTSLATSKKVMRAHTVIGPLLSQ
jgi:hypothetical protein